MSALRTAKTPSGEMTATTGRTSGCRVCVGLMTFRKMSAARVFGQAESFAELGEGQVFFVA